MKANKNSSKISVWLFVLLLTAGCGNAPSPAKKPASVLFLGNSYTAQNNLAGMFTELARSGGHSVIAEAEDEGGWPLAEHAKSNRSLEKINEKKWDFVVLQEQSLIPAFDFQRRQFMYPAVRFLDRKIRESGASPILFLTWGRRNGLRESGYRDFNEMQAQLTQGYREIASELNITVAPVGEAWRSVLTNNPGQDLWFRDGNHPGIQGSYLAASVFYAVIFKESPLGLKYTAGLPADTARFLQKNALETVQNWH